MFNWVVSGYLWCCVFYSFFWLVVLNLCLSLFLSMILLFHNCILHTGMCVVMIAHSSLSLNKISLDVKSTFQNKQELIISWFDKFGNLEILFHRDLLRMDVLNRFCRVGLSYIRIFPLFRLKLPLLRILLWELSSSMNSYTPNLIYSYGLLPNKSFSIDYDIY